MSLFVTFYFFDCTDANKPPNIALAHVSSVWESSVNRTQISTPWRYAQMKMTGQIKPWEWARAKRWFLAGDSYTTLARRCGRSRSTIAAHGRAYKWEQQREAIRAIRQSAGIVQSLRYLEGAETVLLEYIERLNVARTLERVQQAKCDLEKTERSRF
jgi:hypothetical protein